MLYSNANSVIARERGKPDGIWKEAAFFPHANVWQHISAESVSALKTIFPNNKYVNADYGAPNDMIWREVAKLGSYIYVDDRYAVSEVFRFAEKSFNIVTVDENYITQSVNLTRTDGKDEFNINSVTSFNIEKGAIQTRTVRTWWGGIRKKKYRRLHVTETIQFYKNKQASGDPIVKKYISEEWIP